MSALAAIWWHRSRGRVAFGSVIEQEGAIQNSHSSSWGGIDTRIA
jgi:hypothetical protein